MTPEPAAVRAAVRAALARRDGDGVARFAAPLVTAIVADAAAGSLTELAPILLAVIAALDSAGVPRGRQFVLLVHADGSRAPADVAAWRRALGVPVLLHDPDAATFVLRRGIEPIELDDELREAEAIVTVGPAPGDEADRGASLLCPGAAGARTVAAWRALRDAHGLARAGVFSREVERLAPVDLAVTWDATAGATGVQVV